MYAPFVNMIILVFPVSLVPMIILVSTFLVVFLILLVLAIIILSLINLGSVTHVDLVGLYITLLR